MNQTEINREFVEEHDIRIALLCGTKRRLEGEIEEHPIPPPDDEDEPPPSVPQW